MYLCYVELAVLPLQVHQYIHTYAILYWLAVLLVRCMSTYLPTLCIGCIPLVQVHNCKNSKKIIRFCNYICISFDQRQFIESNFFLCFFMFVIMCCVLVIALPPLPLYLLLQQIHEQGQYLLEQNILSLSMHLNKQFYVIAKFCSTNGNMCILVR